MVFFHSPRVGRARVETTEACRVKLVPALCIAPVPPVPLCLARSQENTPSSYGFDGGWP